MEYLNSSLFLNVRQFSSGFTFIIHPFQYLDGRPSRLPRRTSPQHKLSVDTAFYFQHVLRDVQTVADKSRYTAELKVKCGMDGLGKADLDNYCKAVLDGITSTKKIWIDDKQVDEIRVVRVFTKDNTSSLTVRIKRTTSKCSR